MLGESILLRLHFNSSLHAFWPDDGQNGNFFIFSSSPRSKPSIGTIVKTSKSTVCEPFRPFAIAANRVDLGLAARCCRSMHSNVRKPAFHPH